MFHNVNDDNDTYSITKKHFDSFIDYLFENKKIVDIETLIREKDSDNVVISFDDVYESVYENAYQILKEKKIPYYLFVCNEFLNYEGYLKSYMIEEMLSFSEAILASHNWKHELSRFKDRAALKDEMEKSKTDLEKEFSLPVTSFAFPFGSMYACSDENIETAKEVFDYVFTTYPLPYHEDFINIIPRININDDTFRKEMK